MHSLGLFLESSQTNATYDVNHYSCFNSITTALAPRDTLDWRRGIVGLGRGGEGEGGRKDGDGEEVDVDDREIAAPCQR
jgi:hypothetical protein